MKKISYIIMFILLPLCTSAYVSEDSLFTAIYTAISQEEVDSIVANPPPEDNMRGWIDFYKQARMKNAPQYKAYGKIMVAFYRRLRASQTKTLWCGGFPVSITDEIAEALSMHLEAIATEWSSEKFITFSSQ